MKQLLVMEFSSRLSAFKTLAMFWGAQEEGNISNLFIFFLDIEKNMEEALNHEFTEAF